MLKKLFSQSNIVTGATLLGLATFISKFLGVVRDRLFASEFGAGDSLDAYYAAFRIPDLVYNLLILGALSAAFVPVFISYLSLNKEKEAWYLTNSLLNILLTSTVFVCGLLFIFMDYLIVLVAPGFDGEKKELTVLLSRIMLFSPILFCLSSIMAGILNSYKKFFFYALAPIMYNLGIIFGALFLVKKFAVVGLAMGVILGAFLHMLIQLPKAVKLGFCYRPIFDFSHPGIKKIGRLMMPRILGLAVTQINLWVITVIGSVIASGSIAVFNLANNLQSFPISIFGISFATASFPYLTEAVSKNNPNSFKLHFSKTFSRILFFIIPISILMLIMRAQIVRLILGAGKFDWEDTILTAQSLGFFTLSIFAQALIPLLARSFYSFQDTKTPVIISIISVAVNIISSLILIKPLGVMGLALAFSISSIINMSLLFIILYFRIGGLNGFQLIKNFFKIVVISFIMGGVGYGMLHLIAFYVNMRTFLGIFYQTLGTSLISILIFFVLALIFRCEEIKDFFKYIKLQKKDV